MGRTPLENGLADDVALPRLLLGAPPGLTLPFRNCFGMHEVSSDTPEVPLPLASSDTDHPNPRISSTVVSIGSVGHPRMCGKACKYARRSTGCRDGSDCLHCHQCQWHLDFASKVEVCRFAGAFSICKPGHARGFDKACRHIERKAGCRSGSSCIHCHQCQRQGHKKGEVEVELPMAKDTEVEQVLGGEASALNAMLDGTNESSFVNSPCPSVGSIGHPFSCAGLGCKYNRKQKRCKDGNLCLRCHLCPWRRGRA